MRIKDKLKVRNVSDEHIVMRIGDGKKADMTTVVALNDSSLLLVDRLRGRNFGVDDVVDVLCEAYEVDEPTARADAATWLRQMQDNGLVEE